MSSSHRRVLAVIEAVLAGAPARGDHEIFTNTAGDTFWGDVGAGILPIAKSTGRILMAYRSSMVNEPHTWGVIGGALDKPTESVKAAVAREFKEETRFSGSMKLIPAYVFKTPNGSFTYHNFIGVLSKEFTPTPDWETEKFEWMTYTEMMAVSSKHHFGLTGLLKHSGALIKKLAK